MRKRFWKNVLAAALSAVMVLSCPAMGNVAFADTEDVTEEAAGTKAVESGKNQEAESNAADIAVDETNFPDAAFRQYVSDNIDENRDGTLSQAEIEACESINCDYMEIADLTGIGFFYNLKELYCSNNSLSELDIQKNINLQSLECAFNDLKNLDVSKNTALESLGCYDNHLSSLDLSTCPSLSYLDCSDNMLTSLDLSKNIKLSTCICSYNNLKSLDVSKNTELQILSCGGNNLSTIDVGKNTELQALSCDGNDLSTIDVSKNSKLTDFDCSENNIDDLDFSGLTSLESLLCSENNLTNLDVSGCPSLVTLFCSENNLTNLNVSGCPSLETLNCYHNTKLESLDISKNTALTSLECYENNLSNLDVSKNTSLVYLNCYDNQLTSLDVSKNTLLEYLNCYGNKLTSLNTNNNKQLQAIFCGGNQLDSLNLSSNTELVQLSCAENKLTNLDISNCTYLDWLECSDNNLTSLDISKNVNLTSVFCYGNQISSVDTSKNPELYEYVLLNTPTVNVPEKLSSDVKVSWSKSIGADGYYIYRRTKGGSWSKIAEVEGEDTLSYTDKTITSPNTYEYTIRGYYNTYTYDEDDEVITIPVLSGYDKNGKSITIPGAATLGKPTVNTPTKVSNGVKVSWSKVSGATSYYVYRRTKGGSWSRLAIVNGGSTVSYTDTSVKVGTTYEYTVRAYDGKTLGDYDKNGKSITIPASTANIGKPTVNTPTKVSNGVKVSWSKVSGANSYYVYRRVKGGSWSRIAIVNGGSTVSYTDTSVKAGTTYEYTVRAYDGKTLGDYDKNGKSITIPASTTSIGKPTVNTPTKVSNGVKVSWSKVSGANSYYVYRRTKGGSWSRLAIVNGGSTVSYTDTTVKAGTTYEYTVRAYDGKTLGDYDKNGKSITIPVSTTSIGKPTVNTPTKVSNGVKVSWSKVSGANSYYVYRRTKGGSWSRLAIVNGGSTVSYTDTTVKAGTTYEYTVRAYDGKTLGDYDKNGKSITIPASTTSIGKPTVNTPTKVSNGVKVSWSKVSGSNSYYVYRRVKGGSWSRLAVVNGGSTVSYTDTSVKAGTTYEYTVRAYDGKTLGDYDKNGKSIAVTK